MPIEALRRHADIGSGFDAELWDSLVALGLPGLLVPERFGGAGLGVLDAAVAAEVLGAAGLSFESQGEDAEDDEATTWNIDYMYDVGLMIGGGSNNIQKNIIGERGLDLPREPKAQTVTAIGRG